MKKLLILFMFLTAIGSCKKETITPNQQQPPVVVVTTIQDPALMGVWVGDSIKQDGQPTVVLNANYSDTLKVTTLEYKNVIWISNIASGYGAKWETKNDSIITILHYKYSIAGNKLHTYSKSNPNTQYWYHK